MKTLIAKLKASLRRESKRRRPDKLAWGYNEWMAEHRRLMDKREEHQEEARRLAIQAKTAEWNARTARAEAIRDGTLMDEWMRAERRGGDFGRYEV